MSEKRITEDHRYAGLALAEEELVARVAWCYYHDGLTQNDIGERLGLPRLKISRLLEKGRQSGVIRVQSAAIPLAGTTTSRPPPTAAAKAARVG